MYYNNGGKKQLCHLSVVISTPSRSAGNGVDLFALRLRAVIATDEQAFFVLPNVTSVGVQQLEAC